MMACAAPVATAAIQSPGAALTATPGQTGPIQRDPQLDLEHQWRVWQFPYWNCTVARASGGTPVIFCVWVPAHWVVEPYGTQPPQPGVIPELRRRTRACRWHMYVTGGQRPNARVVIHLTNSCVSSRGPQRTIRVGTLTALSSAR